MAYKLKVNEKSLFQKYIHIEKEKIKIVKKIFIQKCLPQAGASSNNFKG
jgi:hypothetical protein